MLPTHFIFRISLVSSTSDSKHPHQLIKRYGYNGLISSEVYKGLQSRIEYSFKLPTDSFELAIKLPHRHSCPHDSKYYREYTIDGLNHDILTFNIENQQFHSNDAFVPYNPYSTHFLGMDLHRLINGPSQTPTPQSSQVEPMLATPPLTQLPPPAPKKRTKVNQSRVHIPLADRCQGVNGQFAGNHPARKKNHGCTVNACYECCDQLNRRSQGCGKHAARTRLLEANTSAAPLSEPQPDDTSLESFTARTQTQLGITYTRHINSTQMKKLEEYRSLSIKKQHEERIKNNNLEKSNKAVSLVVWFALEDGTYTCQGYRVHAASWPCFALNESEALVKVVQEKLGGMWNDHLQVWNTTEQLWFNVRMDFVESYPAEYHKILIIFPGIDPNRCPNIDHHLGSLSKHSNKKKLHIIDLISPTREIDHQVDLITPIRRSMTPNPLARTREDGLLRHESDHQPSPSKNTKRARSPSPEAYLKAGSSTDSWPVGLSMKVMLEFFVLSSGPPKLTDKEAWTPLFGEQYQRFSTATVSRYRRWLGIIKLARLQSYVDEYPTSLVKDGLRHFKREWKMAMGRELEIEVQSPKRVRL
ncbi:hypothetical protein DFH28DRAFT_1163790 [Melampsora americana]|nr:hypothetical protein DFH28DRAFT_1163790 [Melampsora americana]